MNLNHWFRRVATAYTAFVLAVILLVVVARRGAQLSLVALAAAVVLVTTLWLDDVMRSERLEHGDAARAARLWLAIGQLAFGLALVWWRAIGPGGDASSFLGLVIMLLAVGAFVAEWRFSMRWVGTRGRVMFGIALAAGVGGLFLPSAKLGLLAFGLAVVVGYLATELASEDWLRSTPRPHRKTMMAIGAVVLGVVGAFLVWRGGYRPYVVVALIAVVVLVAAAAADSNTVGVIIVLVVALIWATAPRLVGDLPDVDPKPGGEAFVAFGDSYTSGEGATAFLEGTNTRGINECRRARTAYPELLAEHAPGAVPDALFFLACSGAVGTDIFKTFQRKSPPQLSRYEAMVRELGNVKIDFALVGIGGNDADFGNLVRSCIPPGDCSEIGQGWLDSLRGVETKLTAAYTAIRDALGPVPVIAVPYPEPLRLEKCAWSTLTRDEHRFLFGYVRQLNRIVASAAKNAGFYFMDTMSTALAEKNLRICDDKDPRKLGVNFIAANPSSGTLRDVLTPLNWTHNSMHPNARGHRAMLAAAKRWFKAHPVLAAPVPVAGGPTYTVEPLDTVVGAPLIERCGRDGLPYCALAPGQWQLVQMVLFLRRLLAPLVVAMIAAWLLVMPVFQLAAEKNLSTFKILSRLWGKQPRHAQHG